MNADERVNVSNLSVGTYYLKVNNRIGKFIKN